MMPTAHEHACGCGDAGVIGPGLEMVISSPVHL